MSDFTSVTACNEPKLSNPDAAADVIRRYFVDPALEIGVRFDDLGEAYLFIHGEVWPEAWKLPEGMTAEDFDPYVEGIYEIGGDEFLDFLQELSPYLAEPLTVHAIGSVECRFPLAASEWHIEPGRTRVEINELADCPEPVMSQAQLERAVCQATGEDREIVQRRGFSLLIPPRTRAPGPEQRWYTPWVFRFPEASERQQYRLRLA